MTKNIIFVIIFALSITMFSCKKETTTEIREVKTTGTLKGKVTDSTSGNPIIDAFITTRPANGTFDLLTNATGDYQIFGIAKGTYTVIASKTGYTTDSLRGVKIIAGETATANIKLISSLPTNGLVAYYPFNSNANDESGNGNNCTVSGAIPSADRFGIPSKAYTFQNSGDKLRVVVSSQLSLSTLTISAWFYRTQDGTQNPRIVAIGPTSSHVQYYSMIVDRNNNSKLGFYCTDGVSSITILPYPSSSSSLSIGHWYHGAIVYDGTNVKFFIDGILDNTLTVSGSLHSFTSALLQIGSSDDGTDQFRGDIDDIRVYNRALSNSEIQALYHEGGW
jgi:hypothetical protein